MQITRRGFLGGVGGAALALGSISTARAAGTTIGFIYVGSKDDYGWNQSHAVAAAALKDIPGITVVEEENVPETDAVAKTMESMINLDGATLIFPTSFGYFNPFMLEEAKKYPNIEFRHPTSLWKKGKDPDNAGGYYSYMDQGHYVNGDRRRAIDQDQQDRLHRREADRHRLAQRQFLHRRREEGQSGRRDSSHHHWRLVASRARGGVDASADRHGLRRDRLPCRQPQGRNRDRRVRGVKTLGHNADQSSLAPKGFITGAQMKWSTVYDAYAKLIAKGEKLPNLDEGGYDKDLVLSTPFGAGANDATRKAVLAAIDDMKADKPIFAGGVKDNKGNVISAKTLDLYDGSLWGTNYLIEGVIGSIT